MGISEKKSTQQQTQNQNTNMTTTPVNPEWVTGGLGAAGGRISDFFRNLDPSSLVAGPDALQTQAAQGAAGLSTSPLFGQAADIFGRVAGQGPNTYNPAGYGATGYGATGYNPTGGNATGYGAATGQASLIGDLPQMRGESVLDNLQAYMSPYTKDVVDSSLADFDYGAGQQEGQAKLDLAGDATFGGSGGSIGLTGLRADLARGRGTLSAGLRDQGFRFGAGLSEGDANRRQAASGVNIQTALQRALANQGAENTFGLANMDATNRASEFGANATNTFGLANMDAMNTAGQFNANATNTAGQFNAGATNTAGQFNADAQNTAGQYNAGAADTAAARQLAAGQGLAGLGATMGDEQRANIGTQADIGAILQAISQRQAGAPLAALAAEGGLWGGLPLDLLRGSNATGTMSGTSSGTTKESGAGLSDWLGFFAANAAAAAKAGGGGGG